MIGWIKIYRKITDHWIWSKPEYFQWWVDILLQANFEPKKILIKGVLLNCDRGECLYSYETWANRWKINKSKAMRFLKMLEKDSMIRLKNETVTTRLTICNYESYQDERNADETQVKPTKESKEIEEIKNDKNTYKTGDAEEIFQRAGIQGRYFSKMQEVHGLNESLILQEFRKWVIFNNQEDFNSEKHLKKSFNIWLMNYRPKTEKTATKNKIENIFSQLTEEDLK